MSPKMMFCLFHARDGLRVEVGEQSASRTLSIIAFAESVIGRLATLEHRCFMIPPSVNMKFLKIHLKCSTLNLPVKFFVVDPRGIEPRLPPCHGGVIPVYYGPLLKNIIIFTKKLPARRQAGKKNAVPILSWTAYSIAENIFPFES